MLKTHSVVLLVAILATGCGAHVTITSPTPTPTPGTGSGGNNGGGGTTTPTNPTTPTTPTTPAVTQAQVRQYYDEERSKFPTPIVVNGVEKGGQLVNNIACRISRPNEWGLSKKPGGHNCTVDGKPEKTSCDILVQIKNGQEYFYDILSDGENTAGFTFDVNGGKINTDASRGFTKAVCN